MKESTSTLITITAIAVAAFVVLFFWSHAHAQTTSVGSTVTITVDCAAAGADCTNGVTADEEAKLKAAAVGGLPGDTTHCANFICCPERPRIGSKQVDMAKFDKAWAARRVRKGGATGKVSVRIPTSGKANVCSGQPCPVKP